MKVRFSLASALVGLVTATLATGQAFTPYSDSRSKGPLDFDANPCATAVPARTLAVVRDTERRLDGYEKVAMHDISYANYGKPGGASFENLERALDNVVVINLHRWYQPAGSWARRELKQAVVELQARGGYGQSFYYYESGLPVLAVQRRSLSLEVPAHPRAEERAFDHSRKTDFERWYWFRDGLHIGSCATKAGEPYERPPDIEAARAYADALYFKTYACRWREPDG